MYRGRAWITCLYYFKISVWTMSRSNSTGRFTVSCPSGLSLLSCGFDSIPSNNWDAYRGVRPINTTSCECYDSYGIGCMAWCTNQTLPGIEKTVYGGSGVFQANCSSGKRVLGCHISPAIVPFVYDMWRKTYPSNDGSACLCSDFGKAECVATCAPNINDYEIVSAHGAVTEVAVSCKVPGNRVLGCGQKADDSAKMEVYPTYHVLNQTSCLCYSYVGVTCFAICGNL